MEVTSKGTEQTKGEDLAKAFDVQYEKLKELGCPEQILDLLRKQRDGVLKKAGEMTIGEGNIPFLPVIPYPYLSPYTLMSMVRIRGKAGFNYLKPADIKNVVKVPDDPYYIFDIDTGKGTQGKSPEEVYKTSSEQGRRCLTADEVMNLCIYIDILSNHYVLACGSRYSSDGIPNVTVIGGDYPGLGWLPADFSGGGWASATCVALGNEDSVALAGGAGAASSGREGCSDCGGKL